MHEYVEQQINISLLSLSKINKKNKVSSVVSGSEYDVSHLQCFHFPEEQREV